MLRQSKDQTLPSGSRGSFTWIILKTIHHSLFGLGLPGHIWITVHFYFQEVNHEVSKWFCKAKIVVKALPRLQVRYTPELPHEIKHWTTKRTPGKGTHEFPIISDSMFDLTGWTLSQFHHHCLSNERECSHVDTTTQKSHKECRCDKPPVTKGLPYVAVWTNLMPIIGDPKKPMEEEGFEKGQIGMKDMEATLAAIMYSNSGQSYRFKAFRESSEYWFIIQIYVITSGLFQRDVPMDNPTNSGNRLLSIFSHSNICKQP